MVPNLHNLSQMAGLPSIPHNEMLEKLKMQVRDLKVGYNMVSFVINIIYNYLVHIKFNAI